MTTCTDTARFIDFIRTDPADTTARLVYADWLDERGDPDGELVRLLCEVQRPGQGMDRGFRAVPGLDLDRVAEVVHPHGPPHVGAAPLNPVAPADSGAGLTYAYGRRGQ